MSKPHTEQFARDLFGKMGAESSEGFGSFIDIIMELLPTILALFQDCPAADLKNAASGRWVPGKAFGLLRLPFGIRRSLGRNDDRAFGQQLNDAMIELVADSSVERLSGVLQEAQI